MLVNIQMSQYFYVLEGENRRLADSHPPIYRYSNCFWQNLCFSELINRFWKSSPNLEWTINIVSCFCNISWFLVFRCKKCAHYFQNKQDKGDICREYINEIEYWICSMWPQLNLLQQTSKILSYCFAIIFHTLTIEMY